MAVQAGKALAGMEWEVGMVVEEEGTEAAGMVVEEEGTAEEGTEAAGKAWVGMDMMAVGGMEVVAGNGMGVEGKRGSMTGICTARIEPCMVGVGTGLARVAGTPGTRM
jgi:hypothetical protein